MAITSKPLWKLLIDRDIPREDLRHPTGLSPATIAKLGKDGNVPTDALARVCQVLDCQIGDIVQVIPTNESKEQSA